MSAPPLTPDEIARLPHDDRGSAILGAHWGLTALATVFLGLRVYCKGITRKKLWWDDWILIAAWATIVVTDGLTTALVVDFKLGKHSWDLEIYDLSKFIILLSSRATFTLTSLGWTKTAFAVTLLRLTDGATKRFVWFIMVSLNVTTIISALVPWIQCEPIAKTWDPAVDGTCWAPKVGTKVWIGMGAYSALMDFTLAVLPWTFLYSINLRTKEKFGILVAMSMGAIAGAVAIAKCAKLPQLGSGDSYNEVELYIWDVTESTVTMMAACIPTLRVLLRTATGSRPSQNYKLSDMPSSFSGRGGGRRTRSDNKGFEDLEFARDMTESRSSNANRHQNHRGQNQNGVWEEHLERPAFGGMQTKYEYSSSS